MWLCGKSAKPESILYLITCCSCQWARDPAPWSLQLSLGDYGSGLNPAALDPACTVLDPLLFRLLLPLSYPQSIPYLSNSRGSCKEEKITLTRILSGEKLGTLELMLVILPTCRSWAWGKYLPATMGETQHTDTAQKHNTRAQYNLEHKSTWTL